MNTAALVDYQALHVILICSHHPLPVSPSADFDRKFYSVPADLLDLDLQSFVSLFDAPAPLAGPLAAGLSSDTIALITSNCGAMRFLGTKWP